MPDYRRAAVSGGCYFFTLVSERRQPILTHPDVRQALRAAIETVRLTRPFAIDAWVLLPDHLHAIWRLPPDDKDFSNRWRLIKRHVTHACGRAHLRDDLMSERRRLKGQGTLWQQRFWEHLIRDEHDYGRHFDYLHGNPLKHGLVTRVRDWPWSSFHRWVNRGVYPIDWAGDTRTDDLGAGE
ncbi:Transposase IS200 like protein [Pseudomonas sp. THAF187a]|uniref:REP-associated tyrosine transposase n=1 Tax=unclassified Pseudomonas TaxID=196821 RepID=UPI001269840F|nr:MULTISPECIES: transposase [unclassified Pseudomonas]QFT20627.1 Transposase IS200 like protein [Pseudomonas sp. THAF187a]QFT40817.1 Transposase IS200 like protein [Pseudomonas sp. THAF42]